MARASCALASAAQVKAGEANPIAPGNPDLTATAAALPAAPPLEFDSLPVSSQRNGRDIYESFRAGLADPTCDAALLLVSLLLPLKLT